MRKGSALLHCHFFHKLFAFFDTETFVETVYTTAGIHQLLSTGEERMAFGADFHADIFFGGSCFNDLAAGTGDCGFLVLGMDIFFHSCHLFQKLVVFLIEVNFAEIKMAES